jgi:hypothetical protein
VKVGGERGAAHLREHPGRPAMRLEDPAVFVDRYLPRKLPFFVGRERSCQVALEQGCKSRHRKTPRAPAAV